ncbi:hypothetical protein [Mucilaginibacter psychrotolerans]|uniref:Uncharacterized protein n=1 Tax=Mucilaginibacter psychrotolerans TaxID=1524096 RepID=A0A4Y8SFN4_9SPHI|nr:hypothetical protein [Mucilaginibacter psychrotolerans]TFF37893.1 hypothetical protein E2R66_09900 [Mucilaginibacter psychrotolerans]
MTTITIDVLNDKAFGILRDLEVLNLIRIHYNQEYLDFIKGIDLKEHETPSSIEALKKRIKELAD